MCQRTQKRFQNHAIYAGTDAKGTKPSQWAPCKNRTLAAPTLIHQIHALFPAVYAAFRSFSGFFASLHDGLEMTKKKLKMIFHCDV